MTNLKNKNLYYGIIASAAIIVSICICVIILAGCSYTYLCEDDFSFENGVIDSLKAHGTPLRAALISTRSYCRQMQGSYLSVFIYFLVGPYHRWGITGFHIMMVLIAASFMLALYLLVRSICSGRFRDTSVMYLFAIIACFMLDKTNDNSELFFWYTGTVNYTLFFALSFLAAGLCVSAYRSHRLKKSPAVRNTFLVISSLTAFLASLGCIEIAAFNCALLMIIILVNTPDIFKDKLYLFIPFISGLTGAVLNAICPGNFARSEDHMVEGHSTLMDAVMDTLVCYRSEMQHIFGSPLFIILIFLVFAAVIFLDIRIWDKKINGWSVIAAFAGVILSDLLILFPVMLGEHSSSFVSDRTHATFDISARLMIIFLVAFIGGYVKDLASKERTPLLITAALALCTCLTVITQSKSIIPHIKQGFAVQIAADFQDGNIQRAYKNRIKILKAIEDADPSEDVYLEVPMSEISSRSMYGMGLGEDPNWIVNVSAANLLGAKSVTVIYTE